MKPKSLVIWENKYFKVLTPNGDIQLDVSHFYGFEAGRYAASVTGPGFGAEIEKNDKCIIKNPPTVITLNQSYIGTAKKVVTDRHPNKIHGICTAIRAPPFNYEIWIAKNGEIKRIYKGLLGSKYEKTIKCDAIVIASPRVTAGISAPEGKYHVKERLLIWDLPKHNPIYGIFATKKSEHSAVDYKFGTIAKYKPEMIHELIMPSQSSYKLLTTIGALTTACFLIFLTTQHIKKPKPPQQFYKQTI